jgi:multiple sugar transport system permease protein/putative aldouronate transport system permease protein
MTNQNLYPLQMQLYQYIKQADTLANILLNNAGLSSISVSDLTTKQTPTSVRMTVSVVVVLPILVVYPIFQRYFVKGIMIGSVKG